MSQNFSETQEQTSQQKMGNAITYSARIQEAMRFDKLGSLDYHIAMTLLTAIRQGDTQERWEEEQHSTVKALKHQPVDEQTSHTEATNRYEQIVSRLKDMALWPWG